MLDIIIKPSFKDLIVRGYKNTVTFAKEIMETDLHDEQKECLRDMRLKSHTGITCGNRWGKSELINIYSSFIASYKPLPDNLKHKKVSILNTSISQDQANIVFDKFCENFLERPKFSWTIKDVKKSPFPHITFKTGITWWFRNASLNGKYLEGRSYLYANFDEADLQNDLMKFIDDILWPRMWDYGGGISWTTTPRRGKKNAFKVFDMLCKKVGRGDNDYFYFRGDSRNNKFLPQSAIDRMNKLPKRLLNKNVKGLYEDSNGVISNEHCDYAEILSDGLLDSPQPGAKYINIWDFARTSTYNAGITIELSDPLQVRSWERTQDVKGTKSREYWQLIKKRVRDRHTKWKGRTIIDATGIGDVLASDLRDIKPLEIKFNSNLRTEIIEEGISAFEHGHIGIPFNGSNTHKPIEQVLNNEYWCLRDELTDFDPEALDYIIWDMVCVIFIGIWYSKGKRPSVKKKSKNKNSIIVPLIRGVSKNGIIR